MMKTRRAFTLIEVLIALAIFVLAAVILGGAYLNVLSGYEHVSHVRDRNDELRFARADLLTQSDPDQVKKGGEFDSDNHHVAWTATFDPTDTTDVFDVHFECVITGPDIKQPEKYDEEFRVLRPTWSKPADRATLRQKNTDRITQLITTGKAS
jgi:general secretion pathway protein I